ncbi:HSPB1-associated protein 1 homolog isoform X2 [Gadus morhua]|uniref:HSPB1-associated protein 1 homolog isoform X2 n=1 Tax=Gadus morhua TaxID=8049 RepID=UPI0011B35918|nr:HSPB1-associated protein 1 isoform X2 [Gadus morhua]
MNGPSPRQQSHNGGTFTVGNVGRKSSRLRAMATRANVKPFSPTEARRIQDGLQQPAVFLNMASDWPVCNWSVDQLAVSLGDKHIRFRLGRKDETNWPLFETQCAYVEANLAQFLRWTSGHSEAAVGSFAAYPFSEYWAYADYKYIAHLFQETPSKFQDVRWSDFGFEGRDGQASTLWIGTQGANTPCHLDSYGFNLVLQVQGRKRWHLFPPEDTASMYPTRIPYEESSVFSRVDVVRPDPAKFPAFRTARPHRVTLQPGQVLYVPRHWWHYVESLDTVTVSVNTWIELEVDDEARVSEAVTKAVVCALKAAPSQDNGDTWLNPTEDGVATHEENMQCLNLAVQACAQQPPTETKALKRDSAGLPADPAVEPTPITAAFGPHLVLVPCTSHEDTPGYDATCPAETPTKQAKLSGSSADRPAGAEGFGGPASEQGRVQGAGDALPITTNDLLDCLVHPDVISRVTELLLEKRSGRRPGVTPAHR